MDECKLPILVGIDGSDPSRAALRWAAEEASRRHAPLLVVHAGYYVFGGPYSDDGAGERMGRYTSDVQAAVDYVKELAPNVNVSADVHGGDPISYLIRYSRRADMIVLGVHPGSRAAGLVLGSVSQSVAAHARCPVVCVNYESPPAAVPRNSVVVGVSPSVAGQAALEYAFAEASLRGADLIAVRAFGTAQIELSRLGMGADVVDTWKAAEGILLDDCLEPVRARYPSVIVRRRLREDRPEWSLHHESLGARLLVVGAHRDDDHWFSRLGPIASWLLHRAPCPLVVVGKPALDRPAGADGSSTETQSSIAKTP